jgi:SAM-dependent methyltransferase
MYLLPWRNLKWSAKTISTQIALVLISAEIFALFCLSLPDSPLYFHRTMAEGAPPTTSGSGSGPETTFLKFDAKQAAHYSAMRGAYPGEVYKYIMSHHLETGGKTNVVVDVGCGPGNSTRDLAPFFDDAFGVDPSEGMIAAATGLEGKAGSGRPISYVIGAAEELASLDALKEGSVDMITAATAVSIASYDKRGQDISRG